MSPRPPGVLVTTSSQRPSSGVPTDTGVAFIVGLTEWGPPGVAVPVTSIADAVTALGNRVSYGLVYDTLDVAFREGLAKAYVARVVGPAAVKANVELDDGGVSPQATISITAKHVGAKGNELTAAISNGVAANTRVVTVKLDDDVVDVSPELGTPAALAAWDSDWVDIGDLGSTNVAPANLPAVVADTALTGGTDDRGAITDTHWTSALEAFLLTLGPGQVAAPGRTTDVAHAALDAHAKATNRYAILDLEDSADIADLISGEAALADDADGHHASYGPWLVAPGVPGVAATRIVPPSALQLGLCARVDAIDFTAGTAPAGGGGEARYVLDVTQTYSDDDRGTLNDANVNVIRNPYGTVLAYGIRSADAAGAFNQVTLGRVRMAITARADAIGERYIFDKINTQTISSWQGDLRALLTDFYVAGSLFGDTADASFIVDVGPTVNTPASIAAGHLKAALAVRLTESAEFVDIDIVKVPITEAV